VRSIVAEVRDGLRATIGDDEAAQAQLDRACELFETVSLADEFEDFLTLPAYDRFVS
jgi:hypothetical protein